ncbi:pilus assembly protein PilM [bacterium]|nr:pilus assembly protein PilM [bacterium]
MNSKSFKIEKSKPWPLVIGVDISATSMKYVLVKRTTGAVRVEGFGKYLLGQDSEEAWDKLQNLIKMLFKKGSAIAKAKIVVGISDTKVVLKTESLPQLPRKEMEQTLKFSLQQELNIVGDEGEPVVDYMPVGPDPSQTGNTLYLCTAIAEDSAIQKIGAFIGNDIIPDKVIPTVSSIANLANFLPKESRRKSVGIVDIGRTRSVLVIVKDEKTEFFREMMIGGHDLTKSIIGTIFHEGKAIQFGNEEAEEFKMRFGYPLGYSHGMVFHGAPLEEIATMIRPIVERLCGELQRSVEFYKDKSGGQVDEIYLIGGGAHTKHLAEAISDSVAIPVEPLPLTNSLKISGGADNRMKFAEKYLEQAPALSLALEKDNRTNLLPAQYKGELKKAARQNLIKFASLLVVALIAAGWYQLNQILTEKRDRVAQLERQISISSQNTGFLYEALQKQERIIAARIAQVNGVGRQDNMPIYILQTLSNILPDKFELTSFVYNPEPEQGGRRLPEDVKEKEDAEEPVLVDMLGSAREITNDVEVYLARFILDLNTCGLFSEVTLDKKIYEKEKATFEFKIVAKVKPEA